MQDDDDKGDEDVYHRHGGHDLTGHGTDTLHAADEDGSGQQEDGDGGKPRRDGEVGLYGFTDGVALYHSARTDTGDDAEQRKARAEPHPLGSEPVFDEVHGAAHPVSGGGLFTEMHGKEHFAELGGHTHKGGHPHPEQRAGAADVNGCRHAHDVAGPDVGGQRGHQRVERRDFALLGLIGTPGPQVFEPSKKLRNVKNFRPTVRYRPVPTSNTSIPGPQTTSLTDFSHAMKASISPPDKDKALESTLPHVTRIAAHQRRTL